MDVRTDVPIYLTSSRLAYVPYVSFVRTVRTLMTRVRRTCSTRSAATHGPLTLAATARLDLRAATRSPPRRASLLVASRAAARRSTTRCCSCSSPRTYVALGCRTARATSTANWALLEETGTSTNALSQGRATTSPKLRTGEPARAQARVGYRLCGHRARQGGALLRRRLRRRRAQRRRSTSNDALIFLGARTSARRVRVRARPRRRGRSCAESPAPYASFDTDWVPQRVPGRLLQRGRAGRASRRSRSSSTPCEHVPSPTSRSCSSASDPRSITCSSRPARPPRSTWPTTCRPNLARDRALDASATRSPRLAPVRPLHARMRGPRQPDRGRRSPSARRSRAPRSRACSRSTRGDRPGERARRATPP